MHRPTASFALFSLLALPIAAQPALQARAPQQQPRLALTLGVYSWKKPTEVVRDLAPANAELMRLLERESGRKTLITLRVFKTYDECLDKFVAGEVDLVRFGPASYVLAKRRNPDVQLLAAEQEDGKKRCKGVIAVRKDSPIRTLQDLKGRKFAFGDEKSTIGRYLSQAALVTAGVHADDLTDHRYLDRHDKVFKAVEIGDFDAGALHEGPFEDLNEKGQLREICRFDNAGKPWVARAGLDAQVVGALRKALLAMTAEIPLQALKVHGFLPTCDQDFELVRQGMKLSERFVRAPAPDVAPARSAEPSPPMPAPAPQGGKG
jgi:phosphonate transport system substrate-binding protein